MKTTGKAGVEALNVLADPVFVFKVEESGRFRCVIVNRAALEATGFSEKDVLGKALTEIVPEEEAVLSAKRFQEAIQTGKPLHRNGLSTCRQATA